MDITFQSRTVVAPRSSHHNAILSLAVSVMSEPIPTPQQPLLGIVDKCDNFSIRSILGPNDEELATWRLSPNPTSPAIGLIRPQVLVQLQEEKSGVWHFSKHGDKTIVSFAASLDRPHKRSLAMTELCERWRDGGLWPDQIGPAKWREESYPVYRNPFGRLDAPKEETPDLDDTRNYAFKMERSACSLFGVVTYGVHMTVYHDDTPESTAPRIEGQDFSVPRCRIWVPKRARTKQTWPGYLDNSVAGGIPSGYGVFDSLVKEAMEEASIPEYIVQKYAKSVGSVSYFYCTENGWLQPEVEYVYDLHIPAHEVFEPKPLDGEVESFECLPLANVVMKMRSGLFKANCAVVLLDFIIRHGYLTPDNEHDFLQIITRIHGKFDYDRW